MKKKIAVLASLFTVVAVAGVLFVSSINEKSQISALMAANIEALTQDEEIPPCPIETGGYKSSGKRTEDPKRMWGKFEVTSGSLLGIFEAKGTDAPGIKWETILTTAYDCNGKTDAICWVCNRYRVP